MTARGTTLEDFLKEDGNLENATIVAKKRVDEWQKITKRAPKI